MILERYFFETVPYEHNGDSHGHARRIVIDELGAESARDLSKLIGKYLCIQDYCLESNSDEDDARLDIHMVAKKKRTLSGLFHNSPDIIFNTDKAASRTTVTIHIWNGMSNHITMLEDLVTGYAEKPSYARNRVHNMEDLYR